MTPSCCVEIYAPEVSELVYISENAYTKEEVLAMESIMVQVLGFELAAVTEANFLRRFQKAASADLRDSRTDLERFIMLSDVRAHATFLFFFLLPVFFFFFPSSCYLLGSNHCLIPVVFDGVNHFGIRISQLSSINDCSLCCLPCADHTGPKVDAYFAPLLSL